MSYNPAYETLSYFFVYASFVVGTFGIVANILIIITYTRIGITSSINTSYTAMAVSDIGCIIITMAFFCFVMPGPGVSRFLPVIPGEFNLYLGIPAVAFSKITSCITAYIALERCLCVISPLKVKLLFTRRLTIIVLSAIFIVCLCPGTLNLIIVITPEWKIINNRTVLGTRFFAKPKSYYIYDFGLWMTGIILHWIPIGVTVICSIFLTIHLNAGSKWRLKSGNTAKEVDKTKEERIIQTVLMISGLSIFFSVFMSASIVMNLIDPNAIPYVQDHVTQYDVLVSNGTVMTMLNSCMNIFIYYKLGTKFRNTLRQLLHLSPKA